MNYYAIRKYEAAEDFVRGRLCDGPVILPDPWHKNEALHYEFLSFCRIEYSDRHLILTNIVAEYRCARTEGKIVVGVDAATLARVILYESKNLIGLGRHIYQGCRDHHFAI